MANLTPVESFDAVRRLDKADPVLGYDVLTPLAGIGVANLQAEALTNRTEWLKNRIGIQGTWDLSGTPVLPNGAAEFKMYEVIGDGLWGGTSAAIGDIAMLVNGTTDIKVFPSPANVSTLISDSMTTHVGAADPHSQYVLETAVGAPNGVAPLDGSSKIPAANLPSYVDDVLMYANLAAFPVSGGTGIIYVAEDTGVCYRWTGASYLKISDDDVLEFANLAAFPVSGSGATLYIAADTGLLYRWDGAAYVSMGLSAIPTMTMLGNNTGGSAVPTALSKANVQTLLDIGWVLQSRNVAAPNATVPAHMLTATGTEANIDLVLQAKGYGAVTFTMPDGTTTGGNKRGQYAVDLQRYRGAAASVASADYSVAVGQDNRASGASGVAVGYSNISSGSAAVAIGNGCNVSGTWSVGVGRSNTVAGGQSVAFGEGNSVAAGSCGAFGRNNTISASAGSDSFCVGYNNGPSIATASYFIGKSNTGGGVLVGLSNVGGGAGCYAFGASNTPKLGMLLGSNNTQAGNIGTCYALGGYNSITDGNAAVLVLGSDNILSSPVGSVVIGNLANVDYREDYALIRSLRRVAASKTSHVREVHPGGITTDATVTPLTIGTSGSYAADKVLMVEGTVNLITATFVAISSADRKTWKVEASVYQQTGYSAPTIDVQSITEVYESAGATAWNLALTAATGYTLDFNATGVAATTIKWLGKVEITQLQL